jgi:hypothetical protein
MISILRYSAITLILFATFPALASGSRKACLSANYRCQLRCELKSSPGRDLENCLTVCDNALDTCFSFADTVEPPARNPGKKPPTSPRGDAATGGAVLAPD